MSYNVDLGFLDTSSHNASMATIQGQLQRPVLDFCVPINHYFPPASLRASLLENFDQILTHYSDLSDALRQPLAEFTGLADEELVLCNGSTELITELCRTAEGPVVAPIPTFGRWTDLPMERELQCFFHQRQGSEGFGIDPDRLIAHVRKFRAKTLVLCNPNNPTGACFSRSEMLYLLTQLKEMDRIIVDESFVDFADGDVSLAKHVRDFEPLIVIKSLGKSLGWHGIRLGYGVAREPVARDLRQALPYWNINGIGAFVLRELPRYRAQWRRSFAKMSADRRYMHEALASVAELKTFPSQANFFYVQLPTGVCGRSLRNDLASEKSIFVRECSNKIGSEHRYLRVAVRPGSDVDVLVSALKSTFSGSSKLSF